MKCDSCDQLKLDVEDLRFKIDEANMGRANLIDQIKREICSCRAALEEVNYTGSLPEGVYDQLRKENEELRERLTFLPPIGTIYGNPEDLARINKMRKENDELRHAMSGRTVSCVCGGQERISALEKENDELRGKLSGYIATTSPELVNKRALQIERMDRAVEAARHFVDRRTGATT